MHLVTDAPLAPDTLADRAAAIAGAVPDPELPMLTIADLGMLRAVTRSDDGIEVAITPTYSGCPAMATIARDIETALAAAGFDRVRVRTVLAPPWTTDWITDRAREKLRAAGIAPPTGRVSTGQTAALFETVPVPCPRCSSTATERIAAFGSTACKSLWRCTACREPFDHFKCH
jgi:ring-1,2-phenylacetyl-CoA epoxidase subunit PaaD